MAISKYAIPRSSSVLDDIQEFVDNIESLIEDSMTDTVRYAQDDLRESALAHPSWRQYADNLTVHHSNGEIVYGMSGTPEQVQAMNELEYGSQAGDPQPLLRLKAHRYDRERAERMKVKV